MGLYSLHPTPETFDFTRYYNEGVRKIIDSKQSYFDTPHHSDIWKYYLVLFQNGYGDLRFNDFKAPAEKITSGFLDRPYGGNGFSDWLLRAGQKLKSKPRYRKYHSDRRDLSLFYAYEAYKKRDMRDEAERLIYLLSFACLVAQQGPMENSRSNQVTLDNWESVFDLHPQEFSEPFLLELYKADLLPAFFFMAQGTASKFAQAPDIISAWADRNGVDLQQLLAEFPILSVQAADKDQIRYLPIKEVLEFKHDSVKLSDWYLSRKWLETEVEEVSSDYDFNYMNNSNIAGYYDASSLTEQQSWLALGYKIDLCNTLSLSKLREFYFYYLTYGANAKIDERKVSAMLDRHERAKKALFVFRDKGELKRMIDSDRHSDIDMVYGDKASIIQAILNAEFLSPADRRRLLYECAVEGICYEEGGKKRKQRYAKKWEVLFQKDNGGLMNSLFQALYDEGLLATMYFMSLRKDSAYPHIDKLFYAWATKNGLNDQNVLHFSPAPMIAANDDHLSHIHFAENSVVLEAALNASRDKALLGASGIKYEGERGDVSKAIGGNDAEVDSEQEKPSNVSVVAGFPDFFADKVQVIDKPTQMGDGDELYSSIHDVPQDREGGDRPLEYRGQRVAQLLCDIGIRADHVLGVTLLSPTEHLFDLRTDNGRALVLVDDYRDIFVIRDEGFDYDRDLAFHRSADVQGGEERCDYLLDRTDVWKFGLRSDRQAAEDLATYVLSPLSSLEPQAKHRVAWGHDERGVQLLGSTIGTVIGTGDLPKATGRRAQLQVFEYGALAKVVGATHAKGYGALMRGGIPMFDKLDIQTYSQLWDYAVSREEPLKRFYKAKPIEARAAFEVVARQLQRSDLPQERLFDFPHDVGRDWGRDHLALAFKYRALPGLYAPLRALGDGEYITLPVTDLDRFAHAAHLDEGARVDQAMAFRRVLANDQLWAGLH